MSPYFLSDRVYDVGHDPKIWDNPLRIFSLFLIFFPGAIYPYTRIPTYVKSSDADQKASIPEGEGVVREIFSG